LPIEEFHGDESAAVLLADVVNRADIWVPQRGAGFGFATEAFESLAVACGVVRQEFERNKALEAGVLGFEHRAHAAASEFFENAVVRDR
jgi:hypothetical protein